MLSEHCSHHEMRRETTRGGCVPHEANVSWARELMRPNQAGAQPGSKRPREGREAHWPWDRLWRCHLGLNLRHPRAPGQAPGLGWQVLQAQSLDTEPPGCPATWLLPCGASPALTGHPGPPTLLALLTGWAWEGWSGGEFKCWVYFKSPSQKGF